MKQHFPHSRQHLLSGGVMTPPTRLGHRAANRIRLVFVIPSEIEGSSHFVSCCTKIAA